MNPLPERHTIVFVVRIWQEATTDPDRLQWRGQMEHVPTGDKSYFQISDSILQLFFRHLPSSGATADDGYTGMDK